MKQTRIFFLRLVKLKSVELIIMEKKLNQTQTDTDIQEVRQQNRQAEACKVKNFGNLLKKYLKGEYYHEWL